MDAAVVPAIMEEHVKSKSKDISVIVLLDIQEEGVKTVRYW